MKTMQIIKFTETANIEVIGGGGGMFFDYQKFAGSK